MNPRKLLEQYGIHPRRDLGQNFLHDPGILARIVQLAALAPDDTVLEVGPGTGALTRRLADAAARVVAVESDERLMPLLRRQTADLPNVALVHADILSVDVGALVGDEPFKVVANLPYYITSAILRRLLEKPPRPQRLTLTVQREVAERLVAAPGDMSLLAVGVQFYGMPQVRLRVKRGAFWPAPEVESAVVCIDVYDTPPVLVDDERQFFRVVRAGFSQKRKQLRNALASGLALDATAVAAAMIGAGVAPERRAETLSLSEWAALARALSPSL